jgi:hypothetical protein
LKWLDKLKPRYGWLDLAAITGILLVVNLAYSPRDIGWLKQNPSPWIFLPLLMGGRYGFVPGVAGAGIAILVFLFGIEQSTSSFFSATLRVHGYHFAMLLLIGGLSGEVRRMFRKKEVRLFAENEQAKERLKKLDTDIFLLREAKSELERMLATRDAELSTLDTEIRRLFDAEGDEIYQDILLLLNRQARVADAGIYSLTPNRRELLRKGLIGSEKTLPYRLYVKKEEMIAMAIEKGTTITVPEFWEADKTAEHEFLLVVPMHDFTGNPIAVLIVSGMPFISLTRKSVYLISLICRWSARVVEITHQMGSTGRFIGGIETQRVFTEEFFRQNLLLAMESWKKHSLPSTIALFTLPRAPKSQQSQLESLIIPNIRSGDFPADLGFPVPHVAVLLPLSGERGTGIFKERIINACRRTAELGADIESQIISLEDFDSVDEVWNEISKNVA